MDQSQTSWALFPIRFAPSLNRQRKVLENKKPAGRGYEPAGFYPGHTSPKKGGAEKYVHRGF